MVVLPLTPAALVDRLAARVTSLDADRRWRVAVDGAPPTRPGELADALVGPLRAAGRPVVRISAHDFQRPASVRLEYGREDPDTLLDGWLDVATLTREVLGPLAPGGTGLYLPSHWDPVRDRSTRADRVQALPGAILVLDGALLLGLGLPLDLAIHLAVRPATLARRTPDGDRWTLPAFARYASEVEPERTADIVVRVDDPKRPALLDGE
ncbi:uridine kinase [Pengzhenrongella sp.]|uniref:uridine kinase n=1 Tax=Pengzhenrongella sp. TaxID=2888820 RepID=UPI002F926658